jgi:hypothetical protein
MESQEDMKSERVKICLATHRGILSAKHAEGFVYVGRDPANGLP